MASDTPDNEEQTPAADPPECMACRGTGKVVSRLGGEERQVQCPWCEGTGRFIPGHDAQAHWGDAARIGGEGEAA